MILGVLAAGSTQPWLSHSNPAIWSGGWYSGYKPSAAGETVTPQSAMGLAAYYACIDVIASDASVFPINIKRRTSSISVNANDEKRNEYLRLNGSANDNATAITFRRHLFAQCLGWGNGLSEIQRRGDGSLYQLHSLQSSAMKPALDSMGRLYWIHKDNMGTERKIKGDDLLHLCGPTDNGLVGWPMAYWASDSLGAGLAQQKLTGTFFANGAVPSGILRHPSTLKPETEQRILDAWERRHAGGAANAYRVALLMEDMDYKQITVNPKDAELIEGRRFTIEEVCRWFRMKPSKIQHYFQAKGWQTTEADNKSYLLESLMPWLERFEAEVDRKLLGGGEEYYCEHDYARLLQPDAGARSDIATKQFTIGMKTINELRAEEGENPIGPEGDVRFVPVNVQPIDRALNPPEPPPQMPPPGQQQDEEEDDDGEEDEATAQYSAFVSRTVERAAARFIRKQNSAVARLARKHAKHPEKYEAEVTEFMAGMRAEMVEEFAAVLGVQQSRALAVACALMCDDAAAQCIAASNVGDLAKAREADEPRRWARDVLAVVKAIGA